MEKLQSREIHCECGKRHLLTTKKIIVSKDAFARLFISVLKSEHNNILVITDLQDNENINWFIDNIKEKKQIKKLFVECCCASIKRAEQIEDIGQDLIIAIGGEELISVAKYHAYSINTPIFVVAVNNFIDITFSKFSRLYDGVLFNTYIAAEPKEIYVPLCNSNFIQLQTYYISSKFIAIFDNVVQELVYKKTICDKLKRFLKETMIEYLREKPNGFVEQNYKNIWTLVRLGLAMSFYNQTVGFLGGDYAILSLFQAQRTKCDFLELETMALKLVINSYPCFFNKYVNYNNANINKHIQEISQLLKISKTESINRINGACYMLEDVEFKQRIYGYIPYLKVVLKKCISKIFMIHSSINVMFGFLKKNNINAERVEKTFALASCIYARPTTLHLMASCGFMDKLL